MMKVDAHSNNSEAEENEDAFGESSVDDDEMSDFIAASHTGVPLMCPPLCLSPN